MMSFVLQFVFLTGAGAPTLETCDVAASNTRPTIKVSYDELVDHPDRYRNKPVNVIGLFEWFETPNVDGSLHRNVVSRYVTPLHKQIHLDLNCAQEIRHLLQYRWIEVVGLVAIGCSDTDRYTESLLCHFSETTVVLKVLDLVGVEEREYLRITGERNRSILNATPDVFVRLELPAQTKGKLKRAAVAWLGDLRAGRFANDALGPKWYRFVQEQLKPKRDATVEFFGPKEGVFNVRNARVTACACLVSNCDNRWPLTLSDATFSVSEYICETLIRDNVGEWSWERGFDHDRL